MAKMGESVPCGSCNVSLIETYVIHSCKHLPSCLWAVCHLPCLSWVLGVER